MSRGRPKESIPEPILKYKQEFVSSEGIKSTWYWDKTKYPNGPYKVTTSYPEGYKSEEEERQLKNKKLPKTQRRYLNPETGKEVSYGRAKQLGLI